MAAIRQTNFSGGELDPGLQGRTDLAKLFGTGLRTCRNFLPTKQGKVISRPGSLYVATVKANGGEARLVPFVYSDSQSYCVEMGVNYVRFHSNGGTVRYTTLAYDGQVANFTVGHTIVGGISGATGILVSQVDAGATGTLVLRAVTGTFVDNDPLTDAPGAGNGNANGAPGIGDPVEVSLGGGAFSTFAQLREIQWAQSGDVLTITHPDVPPYELRRVAHDLWTYTAASFSPPAVFLENLTSAEQGNSIAVLVDSPTALPTEDVANGMPAREWIWKVTAVAQDPTTGVFFESLPYTITKSDDDTAPATSLTSLPATIPVYAKKPITISIQRTVNVGTGTAGAYMPISYNIYRGRGDLFGFVGSTKTSTFVDVGVDPDYALQPPRGTNPFQVRSASGSVSRTEDPSAVAYFEERRVFAGTTERPGYLFLSASGDYSNYDERRVSHVPEEALFYELAARRREEIRWIVPLHRLLIGTSSSIWSFGGTGGEPLDPRVVPDAHVEEEIGTVRMAPLVVDGAVLYARAKGVGVRALFFNGRAGYEGADVSRVAQHLFETGDVSGVSIVLEDAHFPIDGVPADIVDWTFAEDPWGTVWAVRADGQLLSLSFSRTEQTWGWAHHDTAGQYTAVCSVPETSEDAVYTVVSRVIDVAGVATARYYIERMTSRMPKGGAYDDVCVDCGLQYVGVPALAVTGLAHLEGQSVYALAFGNDPVGPLTVASGQITLPALPVAYGAASGGDSPNVVLTVGLAYTCDLESLDMVRGDRLKQKTVTKVGVEVERTAGLKVGPDLSHLVTWQQRTVAASYAGLTPGTELVSIVPPSGWDENARIAIRQAEPRPVTVLAITREVDGGG